MKVLELYAGSRSVGKVAESFGLEVFSSDINNFEGIHYVVDILEFDYDKVPFKPDIIWASPPCFASNELVLTTRGHVEIKNVRVGDMVLTHKGRWRKVLNIGRKHSNSLLKLNGHGVDEIRTTNNHPFYVKEKKTFTTRKKNSPIRKNEWSDSHWDKAENIVGKYWSTPHNIEGLSYITLLDPYIIGRWLGDGWLNLERGEVFICCGKHEREELEQHLRKSIFKWNCSEEKSTFRFTLYDSNISHFLFVNFNKGAKNKTLPGWVYGCDIQFKEDLLLGYLESDGYKKNDTSFTVSSVSRKLIYGISLLSKTLGYCCNIVKNKKREREHTIDNRVIKQNESWTLTINKGERKDKYGVKFDDGLTYSKVKSSKTLGHNSWVYDIEVDEDHSYTVNNVVVHNCTGFSVAALGHHWTGGKGAYIPKTETAKLGIELAKKTLEIINHYQPKYWFIENPRGVLRKMPFMEQYKRHTVTYCQYGDERMKPTDIWTNSDVWVPRPMCKNGDPCHVAAPRGSKTGTQGRSNAYERSKIPEELCFEIIKSCL